MKTLQPNQLLVVQEKQELDARLSGLTLFIGTDPFYELPECEQRRLRQQATAMSLYSEVLRERIDWFVSIANGGS